MKADEKLTPTECESNTEDFDAARHTPAYGHMSSAAAAVASTNLLSNRAWPSAEVEPRRSGVRESELIP